MTTRNMTRNGEEKGDREVQKPVEPQLVYQEALDAVKELAALFAQSGELQARIVKMLDQGSGLFTVEVDEAATVAAGERVVVYKPSDRLLGIIAAKRACDRQPEMTQISIISLTAVPLAAWSSA